MQSTCMWLFLLFTYCSDILHNIYNTREHTQSDCDSVVWELHCKGQKGGRPSHKPVLNIHWSGWEKLKARNIAEDSPPHPGNGLCVSSLSGEVQDHQSQNKETASVN